MNIVTWNMQGSSTSGENSWINHVTRLFTQTEVEIALLQEAGAPPATAIAVPPPPLVQVPVLGPVFPSQYLRWNLGTTSRRRDIMIYWVHCDPAANRNNLAIAFDPLVVPPPTGLLYIHNPGGGARPAIGLQLPGRNICTLHAISPGGADAPGFLARIHGLGMPWVMAGDFNRDPGTMPTPPNPGVLCPHDRVPTHPGSGTNLDYAFRSAPPAVEGTVFSSFIASDHYPVVYDI